MASPPRIFWVKCIGHLGYSIEWIGDHLRELYFEWSSLGKCVYRIKENLIHVIIKRNGRVTIYAPDEKSKVEPLWLKVISQLDPISQRYTKTELSNARKIPVFVEQAYEASLGYNIDDIFDIQDHVPWKIREHVSDGFGRTSLPNAFVSDCVCAFGGGGRIYLSKVKTEQHAMAAWEEIKRVLDPIFLLNQNK